MRNEEVVKAVVGAINGRIDERFDEMTQMLAEHDKRLAILENHDTDSRSRIGCLEGRERDLAIKIAAASATIGSVVTLVGILISQAI